MAEQMTWRHLSARRVAIIKFLCGMTGRLCLTDLYQNAAEAGDQFIPTAFRLHDVQAHPAIYHCPGGQPAIGRGGGLNALNEQESIFDQLPCKRFNGGMGLQHGR
jgi:hypothetical protein